MDHFIPTYLTGLLGTVPSECPAENRTCTAFSFVFANVHGGKKQEFGNFPSFLLVLSEAKSDICFTF